MGLLDKLKNALFEEEYVEVEEKPKKEKVKKEKVKKEKPNKVVEEKKEKKVEKPIAKKIAPMKNEEKEEKKFPQENKELFKESEDITYSDDSFKFPMMDDDDFKPDKNSFKKEEEPSFIKEKKYESKPKNLWGKKKEDKKEEKAKKEYKLYETKDLSYNNYEKEEEVNKFKPSPIISPIYGVLDKNYKKEDVKDKKEVRLTSQYARDKISVEDVRNKAFGKLEDDIDDNPLLEQVEPIEQEEKVLDFTVKRKPRVNNITMGEAEEYFEDLGLEYNKDYVDRDTSFEKVEEEEIEEDNILDNEDDTIEKDIAEEEQSSDEDDNLFDLIDSMYEE